MGNATIEKQLIDLEKKYWQAMKEKDADTATRLTDDTCIVSGPQGVARVARQAIAGMVRNAGYDLKSFELEDAQVRMLTDDIALVAYKVHEELTVDGKPVTVDASDASTWIRRDGRWVCAMHTEAISGDPYGRDKRKE